MKSLFYKGFAIDAMAEGEGFEPSIRFPVYTLSRRAPSAARPPLQSRRETRCICSGHVCMSSGLNNANIAVRQAVVWFIYIQPVKAEDLARFGYRIKVSTPDITADPVIEST